MAKETNILPFGEEGLKLFQQFNPFKQYKFPGVDTDTLLSSYKQNVKFMNTAQKIASEATQSMMELHKQYFEKVFKQWSEEVKNSFSKNSFEEKITHQAETAKTMVDEMINYGGDINSILTQSNKNIFDSIQTRFQKNLDESASQVKDRKEQR